jgi:peptide/nickel transport system substrate-binding protein/oligopeptide transport system substrate-binding protein
VGPPSAIPLLSTFVAAALCSLGLIPLGYPLLGAGCSPAALPPPPPAALAKDARPRRGGTLRVDLVEDLATLDPALLGGLGLEVGHLVFDTLLAVPAPGEAPSGAGVVPQLAQSWSVSADGLVYTFTLRPDGRYADGSPVRAADFVCAFERLLDPALGASGAALVAGLAGAADRLAGQSGRSLGARALDDGRLELHLKRPDASFPAHLTVPQTAPLPCALARPGGAALRTRPLGAGPFRVVDWQESQQVLLLERNAFYWDSPRPWLDRIELRLAVAPDTAVMRFLRGDTDLLIDPPTGTFVRLLRSPGWRNLVSRHSELAALGVLINNDHPPLGDRRVRQALNLAVDKQDLERLSNGRITIAAGPLPPAIRTVGPPPAPYPHDPAAARRLLAQAGYAGGLALEYASASDERSLRMAESIQADLLAIGIRVHIHLLTELTLAENIARGDFELAQAGWSADFADASNFLVAFDSRWIAGGLNQARYRSPALDALVDAAAAEPDTTARATLLARAAALVDADCPWIWIGFPQVVEVHKPYLTTREPAPIWRWDARPLWLASPQPGPP